MFHRLFWSALGVLIGLILIFGLLVPSLISADDNLLVLIGFVILIGTLIGAVYYVRYVIILLTKKKEK